MVQKDRLSLLLAYFEEKLTGIFDSDAKLEYSDSWYVDLKALVIGAGGTEDCLKKAEDEIMDRRFFNKNKKQVFG